MAKRKVRKARKVVHELNLNEHTTRLRSMPLGGGDFLRQALVWTAVGVVVFALVWAAVAR